MADLNAIIQKIKSAYEPTNQQTLNAINQSYSQQSAADKDVYNSALSQANQTLSQVPQQFDTQRNTADITKNQSLNMLPTYLANTGAATDSGANYIASTNIGNAYQNSMSQIGKDQNAAKQNAQNAINTLNANEAASQAKLSASKSTDYANALASQANTILSAGLSQYEDELSREEQASEAAASRAESAQESAASLAASQQKAAAEASAEATKNANSAVTSLNSALKSDYVTANKDKSSGAPTNIIDNPDAFLSAIYSNSYLSDADAQNYINSVSYRVPYMHNGKINYITLAHYVDTLK